MREAQSRIGGRFIPRAQCEIEQARCLIVAAMREGESHRAAAQRAGVGKSTMYRWMESDAAFAAAVREAEHEARKGRISDAIAAYRKAA